MSFRRTCPVCSKTFVHFNSLNAHRVNLTCGPECRRAQRTERTRQRRLRQRQQRLIKLHQRAAKRAARVKRRRVAA